MITVLRKIILGALPLLLLLGCWQYFSARPGEIVIPSPAEVWKVATHPTITPEVIDAPSLAFSLSISIFRVALGYGLAVLVGVPLGMLAGRSKIADEIISPSAHMFRSVCPLALLPVAIVLIGATSMAEFFWGAGSAWQHNVWDEIQPAMVTVIAWGAFFPILIASISGAKGVRRNRIEAARLMGEKNFGIFTRVVFPHALPSILTGMKIGLGISWMVIVAAELYPGTRSGLGYTIWVSHNCVRYEYTFAAIIYIMLVGVILNGVLGLIQHRIGHWQAEDK